MPAHFRAVDNAVEKVGKVREYVDNGLGVTLDVALDLEEVCKESEQVKELEDTMLQYITMDREMDQWVKAVDLAKTEFNRQYDASRWVNRCVAEVYKNARSIWMHGNNLSFARTSRKVLLFIKFEVYSLRFPYEI